MELKISLHIFKTSDFSASGRFRDVSVNLTEKSLTLYMDGLTVLLTVSARNTHGRQCGIISIMTTDNLKLHKLRTIYPVTS